MRALGLALIAVAAIACGSTPAAVHQPTPTPSAPLTADEQQLLTDLGAIKFKLYLPPEVVANYVFEGAGLDYDKRLFQLSFGGLAIDEWNASDFDPGTGICKDDSGFADPCAAVATTTKGYRIYIGESSVYPEPYYMKLGGTGFVFHQGGLRTPRVQDLAVLADSLSVVSPSQVITSNRKAVDYLKHLHDTAAQRVDFKTYLPTKGIARFELDRKGLDGGTDPLHPYLFLHFGRVANGNEAFEFTGQEFRDNTPLSGTYCGNIDPEQNFDLHDRCTFLFTTPKGISVYAGSSLTTRFDLGSTRVVLLLDMTIYKLSKDDVTQFVDSFSEVPPQSLV